MIKQNNKNRKYRYSARPYKAQLHIVDEPLQDRATEQIKAYDGFLGNIKPNNINAKVPMYEGNFAIDPNGSYTGRPKDPYEVPVQDADDL